MGMNLFDLKGHPLQIPFVRKILSQRSSDEDVSESFLAASSLNPIEYGQDPV